MHWELKLAVATLDPKIEDEDYPLSSKPEEEDRKFTLQDAMALQRMNTG